jgi:hypothetical protein
MPIGNILPPIVPPDAGGPLFTNLVALRDEEKGETDSVYRTYPIVEVRSFLSRRLPPRSLTIALQCG